ncbi:MAG: hypothetical protein PVI35_03920 [Acidimicrobiia bacterium]
MSPRTLELIQRILIALVSVVLALVAVTAFLKVLAPPEEGASDTVPGPSLTIPGDETTTTNPAGTTSTTDGDATSSTSTSTTVLVDASCTDTRPSLDGDTLLRVYYPCGLSPIATDQVWAYRAVPNTELVLTTTLTEMVKGPDAEEQGEGFRSPFGPDSEGSFLSVSLNAGDAIVDIGEGLFGPSAATDDGARALVSTLNANVFQFSTISSVEYRLNGSCDAFWDEVNGTCARVTRQEWEAQMAATSR